MYFESVNGLLNMAGHGHMFGLVTGCFLLL